MRCGPRAVPMASTVECRGEGPQHLDPDPGRDRDPEPPRHGRRVWDHPRPQYQHARDATNTHETPARIGDFVRRFSISMLTINLRQALPLTSLRAETYSPGAALPPFHWERGAYRSKPQPSAGVCATRVMVESAQGGAESLDAPAARGTPCGLLSPLLATRGAALAAGPHRGRDSRRTRRPSPHHLGARRRDRQRECVLLLLEAALARSGDRVDVGRGPGRPRRESAGPTKLYAPQPVPL